MLNAHAVFRRGVRVVMGRGWFNVFVCSYDMANGKMFLSLNSLTVRGKSNILILS